MARVGEEFPLECRARRLSSLPRLFWLRSTFTDSEPCQTRGIREAAGWPDETLRRRHKIATASFLVDNSVGYADRYDMTLELKIRRVGNSLGVLIPTEALALLNVREGDVLFLTEAAEGSVRLSAQRPGFAEKAAIADDLIQRYRNAFNELAK